MVLGVLGVGRVVAIPAGFGAHPPLVRSPPLLRPLPLPSEIPLAVFKRLYEFLCPIQSDICASTKAFMNLRAVDAWLECVLWFGFLFVVSV